MAVPDPLDALRRLATPLELMPVVWDRGQPGQERIYLRANQPANLRDYLLLVGVRLPDGTAIPHTGHVLWLGNDILAAGTWLIVYTGPGTPITTSIRETREIARVIYWNKGVTLFHDPQVIPILTRFESATVQFGQPM